MRSSFAVRPVPAWRPHYALAAEGLSSGARTEARLRGSEQALRTSQQDCRRIDADRGETGVANISHDLRTPF